MEITHSPLSHMLKMLSYKVVLAEILLFQRNEENESSEQPEATGPVQHIFVVIFHTILPQKCQELCVTPSH